MTEIIVEMIRSTNILVRRNKLKLLSLQQKRALSIHEYLSMDLLSKYGINTPKGYAARTPEEAFKSAEALGKDKVVAYSRVSGYGNKGPSLGRWKRKRDVFLGVKRRCPVCL